MNVSAMCKDALPSRPVNMEQPHASSSSKTTTQACMLRVTACINALIASSSDQNIAELKTAVGELRSCCSSISTGAAEDAWGHACCIWNAAVDASNRGLASTGTSSSSRACCVQVAWLRHIACELLHGVPTGMLQEFQLLQLTSFCLKASQAWCDLDMWEQSDVVLAFAAKAAAAACATPLQQRSSSSSTGGAGAPGALPLGKAEQLCAQLFDVHVARYLTALKLDQQVVASQALASARAAAEDLAPTPGSSSRLCLQLAGALHTQVAQAMLVTAAGGPGNEAEAAHSLQALTEPLTTALELLGRVKAQHTEQQQQQHHAADGAATTAAAVGKEGATSELMQQLLQLESRVLLDLAFCQLNHGNDPAACLRCIDALRQLETPEGWAHPAVGLLALQAFLATGDAQQAETEAAGIVINDGADAETCTAVMLEMLQAPVAMPEALKSVLELVLGRFPSDPSILVTFTRQALEAATAAAAAAGAEPAANNNNDSNTNSSASYARALEQLVLQVLQGHEGSCAAVKADGGLAGQLHALLYNQGVAQFEDRCFEAASRLFTASLEFAEDCVKAGVCRVLVTCHLLLRQHTQAANYSKLAESFQPGVVATSFLRFKLALLQGDEAALLSEVSHMATCRDFAPSMLHLACQEALAASAVPAARAALLKLLACLQQQQQDQQGEQQEGQQQQQGQQGQVSEGWVLRALIKLDADELEKQVQLFKQHTTATAAAAQAAQDVFVDYADTGLTGAAAGLGSAAAAAGKQTAAAQALLEPQQQHARPTAGAESDKSAAKTAAAAAAVATTAAATAGADAASAAAAAAAAAASAAAAQSALQLSEDLNAALARVAALGVERFAGDKEAEGCRLLEWMSSVAWNAGLNAAGLPDLQPVALLMYASAQLLSHLPSVGPKHMKQQRLAYLMAAAAALEVHLSMPEHTSSLKLANKMCTAVKGVSNRLAAAGAANSTDAGGLSEAFFLQMQFRVALQQQNMPEQLVLVKQLADHPAVTPDLMHKVADTAHTHAHRCPEVVAAALEGVWRKLMASSSPQWPKVAEVMRRLLQQAGSDEDKLRLYREASRILTMLPKGTFPDRELSWLTSTAWNAGLFHARFGRSPEAAAYMGVALSLLPCCTPGCGFTGTQQAMMAKAKAEQDRAAAQVSNTGAVAAAAAAPVDAEMQAA